MMSCRDDNSGAQHPDRHGKGYIGVAQGLFWKRKRKLLHRMGVCTYIYILDIHMGSPI